MTPRGTRVHVSLPVVVQQRLTELGSRMRLEKGTVLVEGGAPQTCAYFPANGLVSLQIKTLREDVIEVAMVGREGVAAFPLAAGAPATGPVLCERKRARVLRRWWKRRGALRTKIFLTLSDDFTAQIAADLCGKVERLKFGYTISEAGQDARVSILTGRPAAHRSTVSAAKTYSLQFEYLFQPKVFAELQNGQAIVLPYDGLNPLPPTYCHLKPWYLDVQTSYFDHARQGAL